MQNFRIIHLLDYLHIVSSKNLKRMFLLSEPLPDDFPKILFCGNQVRHNRSLCDEFHNCWLNSLGREGSHINHKSGCIRASLALLTK